MHWALESVKADNRCGLQAGMVTTFLLGATFLFVQINEYVHIGFSPQDHAQGTIFYGLTGLHGAHVFIGLTLLAMVTVRAFRGHFSLGRAPRRRGAGHLLALRRRHVDRRLHDGLHPVINPLRSEREAFRLLLYVLAVAVVVIAASLLRDPCALDSQLASTSVPWTIDPGASSSWRPPRRCTCARCACCAGAACACRAARSRSGTPASRCG